MIYDKRSTVCFGLLAITRRKIMVMKYMGPLKVSMIVSARFFNMGMNLSISKILSLSKMGSSNSRELLIGPEVQCSE